MFLDTLCRLKCQHKANEQLELCIYKILQNPGIFRFFFNLVYKEKIVVHKYKARVKAIQEIRYGSWGYPGEANGSFFIRVDSRTSFYMNAELLLIKN